MIRIVKLHFKAENIQRFEELFRQVYPQISTFSGCKKLKLWQSKSNPAIFFTYSIWEQESDLEKYRNSELFKSVWGKTKVLFAQRAEAWSVEEVDKDTLPMESYMV